MEKIDEKEELVVQKSTGVTERGEPCEGDRDCEPAETDRGEEADFPQ